LFGEIMASVNNIFAYGQTPGIQAPAIQSTGGTTQVYKPVDPVAAVQGNPNRPNTKQEDTTLYYLA
jgi:hypothetical protein